MTDAIREVGGNLELDETHQVPLLDICDFPGNTVACAYPHRWYLQSRNHPNLSAF